VDEVKRRLVLHCHKLGELAHTHVHWHVLIVVIWEASKELGLKAFVEVVWTRL
jgi:hypothetical protein